MRISKQFRKGNSAKFAFRGFSEVRLERGFQYRRIGKPRFLEAHLNVEYEACVP